MKVALIQMPCVPDPTQNRNRLAEHIATAAQGGAELVVLQELHNTPYFCQTENTELFDLAEPIPGPSTEFFGELARRHAVVLVTSLFERRAPGLYHNTAVVFERDGSIAGKYRKMHIPDDPAYYEKFYFTPGDLGFEPIDTSVGRLGVQVCWDQWYPEGARLMALRGAELLIYPTAIGYESNRSVNAKRGRQCSAVTPSPTVCPSSPSTASVTNPIPADKPTASNFGVVPLWPVRKANSSSAPTPRVKASTWSTSTCNAAKTYAAGGLSSATAASTNLRPSPAASSTDRYNGTRTAKTL